MIIEHIVQDAVQKHFPTRSIARIEAVDGTRAGLMHLNYSVLFDDGEKIFFRGHNPDGPAAHATDLYFGDAISLEREATIMQILRKTDIPVPEVFAFDEAQTGKYLLLSFLEGVHFRQYLDEQGHKLEVYFEALQKIGRTLASTRKASFDQFGSIQPEGIRSGRDNHADRLADILGRHAQDIRVRSKFTEDEWAELMSQVDAKLTNVRKKYVHQKPQLVIYDLHSRNFNVYAEGERAGDLSGAFDVELAQSAHPSLEWGCMNVVIFPLYGVKWFEKAKTSFLDGYREGGGDSTVDEDIERLHLINHALSAVSIYHGFHDGIRDTWSGIFKQWALDIVRGSYDPALVIELTRPMHKVPKID